MCLLACSRGTQLIWYQCVAKARRRLHSGWGSPAACNKLTEEQRCLGYSLNIIVMRAHGISAVKSKSEYRKELMDWSMNSRCYMLSGRVGPIESKTWQGAIGTTEWKSRDGGQCPESGSGAVWLKWSEEVIVFSCFPGRLRIPFS